METRFVFNISDFPINGTAERYEYCPNRKKQDNKTKQPPNQTLLLTVFAVHYAWPFPDDFFFSPQFSSDAWNVTKLYMTLSYINITHDRL